MHRSFQLIDHEAFQLRRSTVDHAIVSLEPSTWIFNWQKVSTRNGGKLPSMEGFVLPAGLAMEVRGRREQELYEERKRCLRRTAPRDDAVEKKAHQVNFAFRGFTRSGFTKKGPPPRNFLRNGRKEKNVFTKECKTLETSCIGRRSTWKPFFQ